MSRAALLLPLMLVGAAAAAQPTRGNHFATVDGERFRVAVRGETVLVVSKAALVMSDIKTRDRMRQAVKAATGCQIADELPFLHGRLRGKLVC